jgi:hypothetical protein
MIISYQGWRNLFLTALGIFAGTAFCMKWMEGDFLHNGELFSIIGLEISYSREKIVSILKGIDPSVKQVLGYHLYFDYAFMAGVYPGIAALCMMGRIKTGSRWLKNILLALALLQLAAWVCDLLENGYLLQWLKDPSKVVALGTYHTIVILKWSLALTGALAGIPAALRK